MGAFLVWAGGWVSSQVHLRQQFEKAFVAFNGDGSTFHGGTNGAALVLDVAAIVELAMIQVGAELAETPGHIGR